MAAIAIVVVDGGGKGQEGLGDTGECGQGRKGKGKASKGKMARVDEGTRARARMDMVDDNGKQQERALDKGAARRRSSKIIKIGL